jgi:hypothetical protein
MGFDQKNYLYIQLSKFNDFIIKKYFYSKKSHATKS